MHWYLVPAQVSKYLPSFSSVSEDCTKRGTHLHIWWSCPLDQTFWTKIFHIISTLVEDITLDLDPSIVLLNKKPLDPICPQFKLLLQVTTAVKQTIAKAWKTTPSEHFGN